MPSKILVVDDDANLLHALVELLRNAGHHAVGALSAEQALERCREESFHLVLSDLQLPGRNGISLIKTLHESCPETKGVLITGHGSIRTAVTALKRGAVEYITKPLKPRRLLAIIDALAADAPSFLTNKLLATDRLPAAVFDGMHARSTGMKAVWERIAHAAASDSTVLIVGEPGSGKELVARSIHARSSVAAGPFVAVRLAITPPELIAAELFGSPGGNGDPRPGKLDTADGGTLFLDEIANVDARTQGHLLRVLESFHHTRAGGKSGRPANVRVIAAASRELEPLVKSGQFREDLFYRLNIFTVKVPSLRDRAEDVPVLAAAFVQEFAEKYGKPASAVPAETQRLLGAYGWPGNVRELRNVIEQAVLLARSAELDPLLLPKMLHRAPTRDEVIKITIGTAMEQVEKEVILRTLEANDGNKTATAEVLGISRRSIYNKLAVYGIPTHDVEPPPPAATDGAR
jgi:two-component system response regulator AtoC